MAPPLTGPGFALTGLLSLILNTLFVYFAARIVLDRSSLVASLLTALLGTFLAGLVSAALPGVWGIVLAVAVWALVAAFFFRTAWLKGAVIGVVAWLLWALVAWVVGAVL